MSASHPVLLVNNNMFLLYTSCKVLHFFTRAMVRHPTDNKRRMCVARAQSKSVSATPRWSGILWGCHGCSFDTDGKGSCYKGDCRGFYYNWCQRHSPCHTSGYLNTLQLSERFSN
eukprot:Gb_09943 [translate_table: standard]